MADVSVSTNFASPPDIAPKKTSPLRSEALSLMSESTSMRSFPGGAPIGTKLSGGLIARQEGLGTAGNLLPEVHIVTSDKLRPRSAEPGDRNQASEKKPNEHEDTASALVTAESSKEVPVVARGNLSNLSESPLIQATFSAPPNKRFDYYRFFHNGITNYSIADFQPKKPAPSMLHAAIDTAISPVISDEKTRESVDHYAAEFLKTASLFAGPKVGMYSAIALYGLDQVKTDADPINGTIDFALGGAKGATMRKLFTASSQNLKFAPTKGVALGMISRGSEVVFSREMLFRPDVGTARLKQEVLNPTLWVFDGVTFAAGETLFGSANRLTGRALERNRLAGGMTMGASFGVVNGGSREIVRQQAAGEDLDVMKVLKHAGLDGAVGGLGAGAGIKFSDPAFYSSMHRRISDPVGTTKSLLTATGLRQEPGKREFVVTGDQTGLQKFANNEASEATTTVRELKRVLFFNRKGREQNLLVTHKPESAPADSNGVKLNPAKSLIATCNADRLPPEQRAQHVFPESTGPVWMELGSNGRLRFLDQNTYKADPAIYKPLGKLVKLGRPDLTMNVMAPLAIGNVDNPNDPNAQEEWNRFDRDLANAKRIGVDAVSTDVWWGLVETKPGQYSWNYYDQLAARIQNHGLKWVPILSMHQCGGNVGDNVHVPVPFWVWNHLAAKAGSSNPDYAKYKSEQGNVSSEYVSAWATPLALPRYRMLMEEFQRHYSGKRGNISEINVSLGPAGELRYPSYNSHDKGSGYPTRGALQCYSESAIKSFQDFAIAKYGDAAKVKTAWGGEFGEGIGPPKDPGQFFAEGKHHNTQYGRDFIDWYHKSLTDHGKQVLGTAFDVFASEGAPFAGIDIGAKMPGIHWRVGNRNGNDVHLSDRLAELSAGLITTSRADWSSDAAGRGYRPILQMFKDAQPPGSKSRVVPHFTALEMSDGHEGPAIQSMPYSLGVWVGQEAHRQGLPLKGENALSWNLHDHPSWDRMRSFMNLPGNLNGYYQGLTVLRLGDVINSDLGRGRLAEIIQAGREARARESAEAK